MRITTSQHTSTHCVLRTCYLRVTMFIETCTRLAYVPSRSGFVPRPALPEEGMMSTITTAPESREDALIRLADQARTSGVRLYMDRKDGRFYVSSRSQPGTFHRLSGFSCSCRGFIGHGRCAHLAALHAALGWLDPEPTPPASTACPVCNGSGSECGTVPSGRSWRYDSFVCGTCHGSGEVVIAA